MSLDASKQDIVRQAWLHFAPTNSIRLGPMEIDYFYNNLLSFLHNDPGTHKGRSNNTKAYKILKLERPDIYEPLSQWNNDCSVLYKEWKKAWEIEYKAKQEAKANG